MNQFLRPEQNFLEPSSDPSRVAMLVTLGYPLKPSGHSVALADVGNLSPRPPAETTRSWTVGRFNHAGQEAAEAIRAWNAPLPDKPAALIHPAALCKLALHNRRCLLLQVRQGLPLWAISWKNFGKLGNWQFADSHQVMETPSTPEGVTYDTLTAAVAATIGLQIAGFTTQSGRVGWLILPAEGCPYAPAQAIALAASAEYIASQNDPLAIAAAVLHNRAALLQRSRAAGGLNIFHKNGRYAVIATDASPQAQLLAAQHLNT